MIKNIKANKKIKKIALVLLIFISFISVVYAFYSSVASFANQFITSTYHIDIEEEFNGTWGTKRVCFVNREETNADALIRISYSEFWQLQYDAETILRLSNTVNGTNVVTKEWTEVFLNNFTYNKNDGWYYYNNVLSAQSEVCVLNSIDLNEELVATSEDAALYEAYQYGLDFNFESIQAAEQVVETIWEHEVTISNGVVTWPF